MIRKQEKSSLKQIYKEVNYETISGSLEQKTGRPYKNKNELRIEKIRLYCNAGEKEMLYQYFASSDKMREFLLNIAKEKT